MFLNMAILRLFLKAHVVAYRFAVASYKSIVSGLIGQADPTRHASGKIPQHPTRLVCILCNSSVLPYYPCSVFPGITASTPGQQGNILCYTIVARNLASTRSVTSAERLTHFQEINYLEVP